MRHYLVVVKLAQAPTGANLFLLSGSALSLAAVQRLADELLHDPVVQRVASYALDDLAGDAPPAVGATVEIGYRPGVTDNEAESLSAAARRIGLAELTGVRTLRRHLLPDAPGTPGAEAAATTLANDLIETTLCYDAATPPEARARFYRDLAATPAPVAPRVREVPLRGADDAALQQISSAGVLALDLQEMRAVQAHFRELGRDPSDGELETIAQTWSEHCSHKTFKARVRYRRLAIGAWEKESRDPALYGAYQMLQQSCEIDSLIRTFLMEATRKVLERRKPQFPISNLQSPISNIQSSDNWVLSAFVDNAGIIAFGEAHELSFKVETHNHPSALEPFGGANTGVGGVVRDVLGVSGKPIANTDVLCFGPPDLPPADLPPGVLHPRRIAGGVVAGVRDYGNKLGIPTVNGAVLYDAGYTANPLVFCGTLGLAPRGSNPHDAQPGHAVVVLGGRTGRDGIHGATFSSAELAADTAAEVGSAVQIGDPITEKKLLDVLLQARDQQLYSAITDCGAGGLSSAVGEMGERTGVEVDLGAVPLKYPGLQPWEIWLSEAQERMVLAVPPEKLGAFLALCESEDVEATVIGHFASDGVLRVRHGGLPLVELSTQFLFDGRPQRVLEAAWQGEGATRWPGDKVSLAHSPAGIAAPGAASQTAPLPPSPPLSLSGALLALLSHPNIASKEAIVRTYDHEVGGATVLKPLVGVAGDGPGDAAVLQPLRSSLEGVALGCGINPRLGELDPYWMALACADEALRNVVAVGGDPDRTAILDNFCWGDPRQPDRMAGLVRAAAGCYDAALAFGAPFISGKDSLNNEWRLPSGERRPIPPTLLISALASVPDVRRAVTMDLKEVGSALYLLGDTRAELGGSYVGDWLLEIGAITAIGAAAYQPESELAHRSPISNLQSPISNLLSSVPKVDLEQAPRLMRALHGAMRDGLVRACHDLSEGGLAVAAAEMVLAGGLGLELDLAPNSALGTQHSALVALFSESPSRFLVEVRPDDIEAFERALSGLPLARIGVVTHEATLLVRGADEELLRIDIKDLRAAWQAHV
jgi:phosphoribosylformylglycinamidine synthase